MKTSRNRLTNGYDRGVSVLGVIVVVALAIGGLYIVGIGVLYMIAMSNYGNNK